MALGPSRRRALTLVELLVVVAIIGLILAVLVPSLSSARRTARSTACASNLHSLMVGVLAYASTHRDIVLPSYTVSGVVGGPQRPLDGWGPILDREHFVRGDDRLASNPFVCPETVDVAGMAATQTGSEVDNPRGYMDWPAVVTLSQVYPTTIPERGFTRVIRVAYWMNADNLLGAVRTIVPGIFFSGSAGYGPDPTGRVMDYNRFSLFPRPSNVIALADGLYAGRQDLTRPGDADSRIGYRHGQAPRCNVAFADGHVGWIDGDRFPRRATPSIPLDVTRDENLGNRPTVYSDPEKFLLP